MKSRWPVDMEHWVRLDTWSIATWIAQVKSWETNPVMFKEDIKHVKENLLVWDFDLTIVADWSWSMEWEKNRQQKIAILLIFEALKLLHDKLEMEKQGTKIFDESESIAKFNNNMQLLKTQINLLT